MFLETYNGSLYTTKSIIQNMSRVELQEYLELRGFAVYDCEPESLLRDTAIEDFETETNTAKWGSLNLRGLPRPGALVQIWYPNKNEPPRTKPKSTLHGRVGYVESYYTSLGQPQARIILFPDIGDIGNIEHISCDLLHRVDKMQDIRSTLQNEEVCCTRLLDC